MNTIQGGIPCQHHNTVQGMNNLKTLSNLSVNAQTAEKQRKYFLTNLTRNTNAVVAARKLILTSAHWMREYSAKLALEKIAASPRARQALNAYDCLNKQK